jgi:hypothetical protein
LFFADRAAISASTLNSWELAITAVPEPVGVALACFAALFLAVTLVRISWVRQRPGQ